MNANQAPQLDTNEERFARIQAKKFARDLRNEGWATFIPPHWAKMSDAQIQFAIKMLPSLGVKQRPDMRWEKA